MLRDDLYERLAQLKGDKSFSQIIEELLERSGRKKDPVLEALETQNRLLSELLDEVRQLNRKLSGIKLEAKETIREVKVSSHDQANLPSYLRDNPWLEILAEKK